MQFHHAENFRCILSSTCRSSLVIKITLQHRWILCHCTQMHARMGQGASKHSSQRCGAGAGETRLPSGCSWELAGLQNSQSASQVNGTWRTICTRHSFGWKPCCSKPYLGSRIFLKGFFLLLFSFVLICLILLVCGEVFSLKAAVGMQTFVKSMGKQEAFYFCTKVERLVPYGSKRKLATKDTYRPAFTQRPHCPRPSGSVLYDSCKCQKL